MSGVKGYISGKRERSERGMKANEEQEIEEVEEEHIVVSGAFIELNFIGWNQ